MIRLCKVFSPMRHIVYYDYFSLLIHSARCVLCLVFYVFITNSSLNSHPFVCISSCYVQMHQVICPSHLPGDILPEPPGLSGQDSSLHAWCILYTFIIIRDSLHHPLELEPISWILSLLPSWYFPLCL